MSSKAPPGHVSIPEAQRVLGIARQRVYQLIEMGRIESLRTPDGRVWVPMKALEKRQAGKDRLSSGQCISTKEVADFFGVDMKTVREWAGLGLLHSVKIANRLCFSPAEITKFVPPTSMGGPGRPPARAGTRTLRGKVYALPKGQPKQDTKGTP